MSVTRPPSSRPWPPRTFVLSLALLAACGSSDDGSPGPAGAERGPLYLVQTRTFSPDGTTGILIPTPSLDVPLDYSRAIEQPGGGVLYAAPGVGAFLIGSGEEPTIRRYEVDAEGQLAPGAVLSFANEGVVYLYAGSVLFVDARKAYYLDLDQLQVIAFDPLEMAITNTVSLAAAAREGFFTSFGQAVVRPDGVYFPAQWYTEPDWDRVPSGSLLVRVDPATDEVSMTSDERCTSLLAALTTDAGDVYWFSDMFNAFARHARGPANGFPDCALRLRAGQSSFDPDWQLDLGARTGGAPTVATLQGGDSLMWLRVFDTSAVSLPAGAAYAEFDTAPAWQWHLLDLASEGPAVRNDERPLSSMGALGMHVDGRSFTTIENEDYTESILLELTEDAFIERVTARGVIDEVARLR